MICHIAAKQPFELAYKNRFTVFEELIIAFILYLILCFTDWMPADLGMRNAMGILFIGVVTTILLFVHLLKFQCE